MNNRHNPFSQLFGQGGQNTSGQQFPHQNSPYHSSNTPNNYPPSSQNNTYQEINMMDQHQYGNINTGHFNSFKPNQHDNTQNKNHKINQGNQGNQKYNQVSNYDTSINIQTLSPKQLLCQCIDLSANMLKEVVDTFVSNNQLSSPYQGKKVIDFSLLANYILDPARLDKILSQFLANDDQSAKALVKSWLFELKYIRNLWAHSENLNYRLAFRGYDTLGLLFDSFGGDHSSELFRKIETYRKALLVAQVKSGIF